MSYYKDVGEFRQTLMKKASAYAKEKATKGDKEAKHDGFGVHARHLEGFKWDRTT